MGDGNIVGDKIRNLRKAKGKTVSDMAKACGISKSTLTMYECGHRNPRDNIKIKIASYLGKSVQSIFYNPKVRT